MTRPTLGDARELSEWRPPLGVLSVYLGFDPADRDGAWRTGLRNGLDAVLGAHEDAEHSRRLALRATVKRLTERFEDGDPRPPPRGEAGFVEPAGKAGQSTGSGSASHPRRAPASAIEPRVISLRFASPASGYGGRTDRKK